MVLQQQSDANGNWKVAVWTPKAGGPYSILFGANDLPASPFRTDDWR